MSAYNIFRWYRPGWSRYTQRDSLGLFAGNNLYAYVENRPIIAADPFGLYAVHGHAIGHSTVAALNSACGKATGGACSAVTARVASDCGCANNGCDFRPHARVDVDVTIHFFMGNYSSSALPRPVDIDVIDPNSAIAHELYAHIEPAAREAEAILDDFSTQRFGDSQSCIVACVSRRAAALQTFSRHIQSGQLAEDALGRTGQHRRWDR